MNINNCEFCVSKIIVGLVLPLTEDQLMQGGREAMLCDDQVHVMLQQPPCMHPIKIFTFCKSIDICTQEGVVRGKIPK